MNSMLYVSLMGLGFPIAVRIISSLIYKRKIRNEDKTIGRTVIASMLAFCVILYEIGGYSSELHSKKSQKTITEMLGLNFLESNVLVQTLRGVVGILCLFCVPLWYRITETIEGTNNDSSIVLNFEFTRDFVIAPIIEEVLYRSVIYVNLVYRSGMSSLQYIVISSLIFSLCHLAIGFDRLNPSNLCELIKVVQLCCVNIVFSFILGSFNSFIYSKTRNLMLCVIFHSICNFINDPFEPLADNYHGKVKDIKRILIGYVVGLVLFLYTIFYSL